VTALLETSLATGDLDRSRRFFEDALGLDPERIGDTSVSYEAAGCELKLQGDFPQEVLESFNLPAPPADGRGGGATFVLAIDEPLASIHERVAAAAEALGCAALIEPRDVPWGVRTFLARSPEGYVFEVRGSDS